MNENENEFPEFNPKRVLNEDPISEAKLLSEIQLYESSVYAFMRGLDQEPGNREAIEGICDAFLDAVEYDLSHISVQEPKDISDDSEEWQKAADLEDLFYKKCANLETIRDQVLKYVDAFIEGHTEGSDIVDKREEVYNSLDNKYYQGYAFFGDR